MRSSTLLILAGALLATSACDAAKEPASAAPTARPDTNADRSQGPAEAEPKPVHAIDSTQEAMPEPSQPKPLDPTPTASTTVLTLEAATPAARGGKIVLNVGVPVPGGRVAPTLSIGCALPCWQPIPMWPKRPEDDTVEFSLMRASATSGEEAHDLGTYVVGSVPAPPAGTRAEVVVGIGVVDGDLVAHARLRSTGVAVPLARKG